jgi:excisionase family DNA binding protein
MPKNAPQATTTPIVNHFDRVALATRPAMSCAVCATDLASSERVRAAARLQLSFCGGGRDRLLRVAEVAEQLAIGAWAVYKLCEDGDLPHVRITNSIRVRPKDLEEFVAARRVARADNKPNKRRPSGET